MMTELKIEKDEMPVLKPRMTPSEELMPEVVQHIQGLYAAAFKGGVPPKTIALMHIRISQINGCSFCVVSGSKEALERKESPERVYSVAAWRDSPYYTNAERAALALAESVTRMADRPDPVPDEVWNEARKYYDERGLSALLVAIAVTNVFNRFNVPLKTVAGVQQK
jgi:AhpD family alkylhydroperoxidase